MQKFFISNILYDITAMKNFCILYNYTICLYNIAFNEIQTDRVIIQNAEVFHCGDVIQYVADKLDNSNYLVFDVCSLSSLLENHDFYKLNTDHQAVYNSLM